MLFNRLFLTIEETEYAVKSGSNTILLFFLSIKSN